MTKTYLGYGYTNNRGVAKLEYTPNDEPLEQSGYKNNNNYDTQVSASFTHQNKTYNSNTKQYNGTILSTILYYNDGTKTDLQRPDGGSCTTNGEHLILGDAYKKRFMLPVTLNGDWEFSFNIKFRIGSAFNLVVGNVEIADGNSYDAGTVIKLVCEQGTVKEYVNDTLISSNTISSSNYSIGIKPIVNSFFLYNLQVKRLEE